MKKIKLTQGKITVVDDEDFEWLSQYRWCYSHGYALRATNAGARIYMHREVNKTPEGSETDHINRNKLDNRKVNLRSVTRSQNTVNHTAHKHNITGIKGVVWDRKLRKYRAQIGVDKKRVSLGYFDDIAEALKVRKEAEHTYYEI